MRLLSVHGKERLVAITFPGFGLDNTALATFSGLTAVRLFCSGHDNMEPIGNGSEGDAYRYTKKVLKSLPNANSLCQIYTEVAETRGISSWTRAAYQDLRAHFFRDGQCKIRFAPGAARIAFGELSLGTGDEEPEPMGKLHDIIRIISIAHADEYDRYLGRDGHRPSFKEFDEMYGQRIAKHWTAMKRMLRRRKYGKRRYTIVPLDDFATANAYHEYTEPHGWHQSLNSAKLIISPRTSPGTPGGYPRPASSLGCPS